MRHQQQQPYSAATQSLLWAVPIQKGNAYMQCLETHKYRTELGLLAKIGGTH